MEIPSYFKRYLSNIQPPRSSRERAIQLHTTLRKRLAADQPYQDCYRGSFLYGLYRRNTAIKRIKDVDVCVLLELDIYNDRPGAVVDRLRRVLERQGYEAKTALQRRSVRIDLSETTLDVVPVVDAREGQGSFLIPDRKQDQWVPTYPREHLDAVNARNKECNDRFVPLAKIVKAWFRYQTIGTERPKPKGFTLEAMLMELQDKDAPSYAEGFVHFLEQIDTKYGTLLSWGTFPEINDPARPGIKIKIRVSEDEAKRFGQVVKKSLEQSREALASESVEASAKKWSLVFGPDFPVVPATSAKIAESVAGDEEEPEDALDEEISSVDLLDAANSPTPTAALSSSAVTPLPIVARLARSEDAPPSERYPSNGRALPKNWWIVFTADTGGLRQPYDEVHWTVQNHGTEAAAAEDSGHERSTGTSLTTRRSTRYRGSHTMTCELKRNGVVVARGSHKVNVK